MDESERAETLRAMRAIRRHLTVAFLAVEHLCRKVGSLLPAQRLCSIATDALGRIRDEVVGIEARIMRDERRHIHLPEQFPEHPPER